MAGRPSREQICRGLDEAVVELRVRLGSLPDPIEAEDIWTAIWHQEAHNSTAIEGNTLVLRQVEVLLQEGRAVGDKELKEYMEVKGYADAACWVYSHAIQPGGWSDGSLLTLTEVRHVHRMALEPVWDVAPHPNATDKEAPGSFREHDIAAFPGGMTPRSWTEVPGAMRDWLRDLVHLQGADRPIETLAASHSEFERIHPFLDGNGRTGRHVTCTTARSTGPRKTIDVMTRPATVGRHRTDHQTGPLRGGFRPTRSDLFDEDDLSAG